MTRWLACSLLLMMAAGCRAQDTVVPDPPPLQSEQPAARSAQVLPSHRVVALPPDVGGDQPVLWVSLADHLGSTPDDSSLELRSERGAALNLQDSTGRRWSAPSLRLQWREVPLDRPLSLSRRVAGPFASFESAERVAKRWRESGAAALVAHPGDWEVWAPAGSPVPDGLQVRDWSTRLETEVQPVLALPEDDIPLQGPLALEAPQGLRWGKGLFQGPFRLQRDAYGSWTLVEQVPLERYLEGVLPHEIGAGSPAAALRAQAVLARTWALANSHRFEIDGYHLCSDTQCQVYSDPRQAGDAVRQAIAETAGQVLSWDQRPISAVYHASNGGVMASGTEAWSMEPKSYLQAAIDGDPSWRKRHGLPLRDRDAVAALLVDREGVFGRRHPLFRWRRLLSAAEIRQALGPAGAALQAPLQLTVLERGESGRVLALQVSGSGDAAPVVLRLDRIRRTLRRLPSTLFVVDPQGSDSWQVRGGGFGHGAGLSQAGAIDLANRGWSTERILEHYYPGTVYGPLSRPQQSP